MQTNKEKKDQFVIAWMGDLQHPERVISHAVNLASILKKGLILLYIDDPRYKGPGKQEAEQQLQSLRSDIVQISDVSYCAMKGNAKQIADLLPTMLNGVVVVVGVDVQAPRRAPSNPREVLRVFAECKIAFLTVQKPFDHPERMLDIAFSVDFRKESKEKLIWASYYARFGGCRLHVLYNTYKDEGLRTQWYNNMKFMTKFFNSLGVTYQPHEIAGRSTFAETLSIDYCQQHQWDMLISVTTDLRNKDALELIIGTQEQRTIRNTALLPILFINPRDDIYVLCD